MSQEYKRINEKEYIEPMIFNDEKISEEKNNGLIRPMEFDVRTKSVEEKIYIILYKIVDENNEDAYNNIYSICLGRIDAYNDIKNKLISGDNVDIHKSIIITETKQTETETGDRKYYLVAFEDAISVYSFMISVQDYFSGDDFDIEIYNEDGIPEERYNELESRPHYLTPEQIEYRNMLEASMKRDKLFLQIRQEQANENVDNV